VRGRCCPYGAYASALRDEPGKAAYREPRQRGAAQAWRSHGLLCPVGERPPVSSVLPLSDRGDGPEDLLPAGPHGHSQPTGGGTALGITPGLIRAACDIVRVQEFKR